MESNVRTLTRCDFKKSGAELTFIIEGDGFLYKMCRGIVGTLVQVGQGKIPLAKVENILSSRDGHDCARARFGFVESVLRKEARSQESGVSAVTC